MIQVRPIPAFDDNYIWLIGCDDKREVLIVDPGDEEPVIELIEREQLSPLAILITHHHHDHVGGIESLVERYHIPVYGPAQERIPARTHALSGDEQITFPEVGLTFSVFATPGHTLGHLCYYGHSALFCGDTLFTGGCGRLFEGTPQQMYESLQRIAALPEETQIYCAHEYTLANLHFAQIAEPGNEAIRQRLTDSEQARAAGKPTVPAPLALEKATNPFLRTHVSTIIEGAERFAGHRLRNGGEIFGAVRRWKDSLD